MIVTRVSSQIPDGLNGVARRITDAITQHTLVGQLDALVLIGTGDADQVRPGDPPHRVVVPLIGRDSPTAIGRAQVAYAHAVVLLDSSEVERLPGANALTILAAGMPGDRRAFLGHATFFESVEAEAAVRSHPALRAALAAHNPALDDDVLNASAVADAVYEAIVAVTPPGPQAPDRIG